MLCLNKKSFANYAKDFQISYFNVKVDIFRRCEALL